MTLNKKRLTFGSFILLISAISLFHSCASIQQPMGGPKDSIAPSIINETPKNYTKNFKAEKIIIEFDEYFKLNNEYTEISISPYQEVPPIYRTKQKRLEIELKDTLETNTTYTINFGKAIGDVNENNLLKNYTYVFATGNQIDSLQISGKVINSSDNKPVLDATVFIIPVSRDSIFGKRRPSIFTATDSSGNFTLKNLKEEKYRVYALKEETGGDRIYNSPKEDIAYLSEDLSLNKDTSGILLKLFKEIPDNYRVLDKRIEKDGKITLIYNRPIENPAIKFISPSGLQPIISYSKKSDTTSMWLPNMEFDSVKFVVNDKDKILDTITLKRNKRDTYTRTILFSDNLLSGKIVPGNQLIYTFNLPIENMDKSKITLLQDSLLITNYKMENIDPSKRIFRVMYPWKTKKQYTLEFKDDAVTDIYGTKNKALTSRFQLDEIENYGNLNLNISRSDTSKYYIVQILNEKNNVYKESTFNFNSTITYNTIPNGKYLVKVIEDINKNGLYDTGNVKRKEQPEKSWFFDKEIVIRPNWDREEKIIIPADF
jgi:hypothetical protein